MKTLKKLFLGIGIIGLASCGNADVDQDYSFNLDGLIDWQKPIFAKSREYWGIDTRENRSSENRAFLGYLKDATRVAETRTNRHEICDLLGNCKRWKEFEIVFSENANWQDCSGTTSGIDFLKVYEHEDGHVLGYGHSQDKNNIMYAIAHSCGEINQ